MEELLKQSISLGILRKFFKAQEVLKKFIMNSSFIWKFFRIFFRKFALISTELLHWNSSGNFFRYCTGNFVICSEILQHFFELLKKSCSILSCSFFLAFFSSTLKSFFRNYSGDYFSYFSTKISKRLLLKILEKFLRIFGTFCGKFSGASFNFLLRYSSDSFFSNLPKIPLGIYFIICQNASGTSYDFY